LPPQLVQAEVGHNPVNPRIKRALEAEIPDIPVGLQKRLLVNVLGVVLAAGQVQRQPQHLVLILPHQRVKGRPRTRLRLANQLHLRRARLHPLLGALRSVPLPCCRSHTWEDCTLKASVVARLSEFLGIQTNNYAEYSGLLAVFEVGNRTTARNRLRVISDSELMVKQMKGQYKVKSPGLRPLWEEAKRRAARLDRFEMRHTLRGGNREADRLANEAMEESSRSAASVAHQS
jgi:ribonuclease HI